MGLDMYAFSVPAAVIGDSQVNFEIPEDIERKRLAYWRKFNHLHGWMEDLYRAKGGTEDSFNCVPVRLMPEDLVNLTGWVLLENKPSRAGFFFGGDEIDPRDITDTVAFIKTAQEAIENGEAVYYDSWW